MWVLLSRCTEGTANEANLVLLLWRRIVVTQGRFSFKKILLVFCDKLCPVMSGKKKHHLNWVCRKMILTLSLRYDQAVGIKELRLWFAFWHNYLVFRSQKEFLQFKHPIIINTYLKLLARTLLMFGPNHVALMVQLYDFSYENYSS